uniref:DUF58 domain-containing protein n=1 Tax=candidate division WOR-3 bacterium TaxID=2052148 RepID=A0A7C4YGC4_UNCW3
MIDKEFLKPEVILKIKNLDIRARLIVEGIFSGIHTSSKKGLSCEFTEHKIYNSGEPVNLIDWKVYGRTERLFLKKFEEESNMKVFILLDVSNSMDFGEPVKKIDYAKTIVATLSLIFSKQNDSVGLVTFNEDIVDFIPPVQKRNYFNNIYSILQKRRTSKKTDISKVLYHLSKRIKKRNYIIIISDFLSDIESLLKPLKGLSTMKNEIRCIHILTREEIELNSDNAKYMFDLETGKKILVDPNSIRREYRKLFNNFLENLRFSFNECKVHYNLITTDNPFDRAFMEIFKN